jgi:hypothetical protein
VQSTNESRERERERKKERKENEKERKKLRYLQVRTVDYFDSRAPFLLLS